MLRGCASLTDVDLSALTVSNVTNMSYMFYECSGLKTVSLESWVLKSTNNSVDATSMFQDCRVLRTIYVGKDWVQSRIRGNSNMFQGCVAIKGADGTTYQNTVTNPLPGATNYAHVGNVSNVKGYLSAKHWVTGSVWWSLDGDGDLLLQPITGLNGEMDSFGASNTSTPPWENCKANVKTFHVLEGTQVGVVKGGSLANFFADCVNLTDVNLDGFDTSKNINLYRFFENCTSLTSIDLSNFATDAATSMYHMSTAARTSPT